MKTFIGCMLQFSLTIFCFGCSLESTMGCKPVLPVYIEYGPNADLKNLPGTYVSKADNRRVEFFGLQFDESAGWRYEEVHRAVVRVERMDYCQGFLIIYNKGDELVENMQEPELIGCKDFSEKGLDRFKTDKDYFRDLFSFTTDQLDEEPIFWQYWILWMQSRELKDISALYHYTGRSLEAFQKNTDALTRLSGEKGTRHEVVVFPDSIAPDYLTIVADDLGDKFIADFLDMLNTLNP